MVDMVRKSGLNLSKATASGESFKGLQKARTQSSFTAIGNVHTMISDTVAMVGYRAYMVLDTLHIEPLSLEAFEEVVSVDNTSVKEFIRDRSKYDPKEKKEKKGISLKLFLDGRVNVGSGLEVLEGPSKGLYSVMKVTHYLDYEGSWWDTEVKGDLKE